MVDHIVTAYLPIHLWFVKKKAWIKPAKSDN